MVIADFTASDAFLTVLEIFFFVVYFWILITILSDLFRDHELSGWAKAGWVLFLVLIPMVTVTCRWWCAPSCGATPTILYQTPAAPSRMRRPSGSWLGKNRSAKR